MSRRTSGQRQPPNNALDLSVRTVTGRAKSARPAARRVGGVGRSDSPKDVARRSRWGSRSGKGVDDAHHAHPAGRTPRSVVGGEGDIGGIDATRRRRETCHGRGDELASGLSEERFPGGAEQPVVANL